jgi:phosphoserine aminotransferase
MFQTNAAFGLPFPMVILLIKSESISNEIVNPADFTSLELAVLSNVLDDYCEKGIVQIEREIKYKAAVLNQAVESNDSLDFSIEDKQARSFSILGLIDKTNEENVAEMMYRKGYVLSSSTDDKAKRLSISNYPTHSKEQMELLADLLAEMK